MLKPDTTSPLVTLGSLQPCVVLVRPEGPLNVGLVARACANFDASLRLVQCTADLESVEFRMTSVHAEHVVAGIERFESLQDALADLQWVVGTCGLARDPKLPSLGPEQLTASARRREVVRLGMVFGNEAQGLSNAELGRCDAVVRIAASPRQPSLNLSHAVAVSLCALYQPGMPPGEQTRGHAALRDELDLLRDGWVSLMRDTGYLSDANETRLPASLDRMFRRWGMLRGEVRTMMGMLRYLRERGAHLPD